MNKIEIENVSANEPIITKVVTKTNKNSGVKTLKLYCKGKNF